MTVLDADDDLDEFYFYDPSLTAEEKALVEANLGLVHWTVRKWCIPGEYDDRVQDGMFGLMRAAQLFDHSRGFKFSTYAVQWIRQAIGRGRDVELGSARRSALRAGEEWSPPVALDATTGDGRALADTLIANDDDPADTAVRAVAVTEVFAACVDDLDRAVLVAVATGRTLNDCAHQQGVSSPTTYGRFRRIAARAQGLPDPERARALRKSCSECGSPCAGKRCRSCHDASVAAELAESSS